MTKTPDEPRSLLRRLLRKADGNAPVPVDQLPSATPSKPIADPKRSTAPVRPVSPDPAPEPAQPIIPSSRAAVLASGTPAGFSGVPGDLLSSNADPLKAEEALLRLREKTAHVAAEFAEGKLNRAQFAAMYARYNEVRTIIERLLTNNPNSEAWQRVARPGHTGFLRQHFESQIVGYAIFSYGDTTAIISQGENTVPNALVQQILTALRVYMQSRGIPGPAGKRLDGGKWVTIIAGQHTVTLAQFSLEPSAAQVTLVQDIHRDFERANRLSLSRGIRAQEQLVFPHRALMKKS